VRQHSGECRPTLLKARGNGRTFPAMFNVMVEWLDEEKTRARFLAEQESAWERWQR